MNDTAFKFDVDESNFQAIVLDNSMQTLVVVDFWASWCGPCQNLMPLLEKLAEEYQGKFILAKVNTDEQQALATQFGVRSLPTVKFFRNGQIVDEFMGAQPESAIRPMLDRHVTRESDSTREQALVFLNSGHAEQAIELLQQALQQDPDNYAIHFDLIRAYLLNQQVTEARELYNTIPSADQLSDQGEQAAASITFAESTQDAVSISEAKTLLQADPKNPDGLFGLALGLHRHGAYPESMDALLALMQAHPSYKDGIAKSTLLRLFTLLDDHPDLVSQYRRKMASLLY